MATCQSLSAALCLATLAACTSAPTTTFVMSALVQPGTSPTITVTAADLGGASAEAQALLGTSIQIPTAALSQPTTIQIDASSVSVAQSGQTPAGPVVDLEPSPMTFAAPVTVSIPVTAQSATLDGLLIEAVEPNGIARNLPVISLANGLATFQTSTFTRFGAVRISSASGAAGTTGGGGTSGTIGGGSTSGAGNGGPVGGEVPFQDAGCATIALPDSGVFFVIDNPISVYDSLTGPSTILIGQAHSVCAYPLLQPGQSVLVMTVSAGLSSAGEFNGNALAASLVLGLPDGGIVSIQSPDGDLRGGVESSGVYDGIYNLPFPCSALLSDCGPNSDDEVGIFNANPLSCACEP